MHAHGGHPDDLISDPRLRAVGLLYEAQAWVRSAVEPELERHGLTSSSFEVLIRLARAPDQRLRMTDLAVQSTLSNSGLTRVIDRLRAGGFVERDPHDRDRRVIEAVLTPQGRALLVAALPSHLATIDQIITDVLTEDEVAALERTLRKIRAVAGPPPVVPLPGSLS